ncbi:PEPxxWA-CTERM sorting domain-containing protein [Rhizorhabdus dicambivorans]
MTMIMVRCHHRPYAAIGIPTHPRSRLGQLRIVARPLAWEAGPSSCKLDCSVFTLTVRPTHFLAACALSASLIATSAHSAVIGAPAAPLSASPSRILIGTACWIEPGSDVLVPVRTARPKHRTRAARAHHATSKSAHARHGASVRRAGVRARPHRPAAPAVSLPLVRCDPFEPQLATIEPFAETMARMMEPAVADEIQIQKLIQKRKRRPRRRPPPPVAALVSAAPEPASWLMMIAGFGAIGWAVRRRPRQMARGVGPASAS